MSKKTIKLTKSDLNEMVMNRVHTILGEEPVFPSDVFIRRKSNEDMILESALLGEGLIRTYPLDWVEKYLQRNANSDFIHIHSNKMEKKFLVTMKQGSKSIEPLKHTMDAFGYYCSYELENNFMMPTVILQFEPKFDDYIKGSDFNAPQGKDVFYHVAPIRYKDKILAQGLVPRHRNKLFKYPARVYFMLASSGYLAAYYMAKLLCQDDKNKENGGEYAIFGVTLDGLDEVKFYRDWNVEHAKAYYTHENIPPANIHYIDQFNVKN